MLKVDQLPEFIPPLTDKDGLNAMEGQFAFGWEQMACQVHMITREKGFWAAAGDVERNQPEMIALIHSELSEALEALRKDPTAPDAKVPQFTNLECELADAVVRIMDMSYGLGLRLPEALAAKVRFNATRPAMHNKAF